MNWPWKANTRKKAANGNGSEIDEHDLPTEPVPHVTPEMDTVPVVPQQPITLRPPEQGQSYPAPPNAPKFDVYPYPQPSAPQQPYPVNQPATPAKDASPSAQQAQRSRPFYLAFIPVSVGFFFVCLQLLLLARFILRLTGIGEGAAWVNTIYALCDIILLPFQALLPTLQLPTPLNTRIELYALLAVFIYGILSRILVRLLKIFLGLRPLAAKQNAKE